VKTPTLKSRGGAAAGKATIEAFRRGFCGQALLPGDAGYDSARRIWNASIDKHPGLIFRCSDPADVVRAAKFSRALTIFSSRSKAAVTTSPGGPCAMMALSSTSRR
jgi:hypothetical protein